MAVEMRDRVIELAAKWQKLGHDLGFGMGIAHGYATLGRISSEGRFDYTAIGRVVNLAARLCGEAKSGQILVDGKVHTAVEALAEYRVGRRAGAQGLPPPGRGVRHQGAARLICRYGLKFRHQDAYCMQFDPVPRNRSSRLRAAFPGKHLRESAG